MGLHAFTLDIIWNTTYDFETTLVDKQLHFVYLNASMKCHESQNLSSHYDLL